MAAAQPKVHYTYNVDQANGLIARLTSIPGPLGFDIEWRPNFQKGRPNNPVALVQLSNANQVVLIQLSAMSRFPANLKEVLANPAIIKAGVGIEDDMRKLYQDCNVSSIRACVDLALLARNVDNAQWKGRYRDPIGLARLALAYMNKELIKGKVTRSNWENVPLTSQQIEYAANDAHAGYGIYTRLASFPVISELQCRYYMFDMYNGQTYNPSQDDFSVLIPWDPFNPNYNPGPPPEPKPKKTQKGAQAPSQSKAGQQQTSEKVSPQKSVPEKQASLSAAITVTVPSASTVTASARQSSSVPRPSKDQIHSSKGNHSQVKVTTASNMAQGGGQGTQTGGPTKRRRYRPRTTRQNAALRSTPA